MKGQSSVGKRIIWALSMVVLCTFLTFFMSLFLGSAFPKLNVIYKAGIPVIIFVALGLASFGLKSYFLPFLNELSVPNGIKKALPVLCIGLGILLGQLSFDEYAGAALETEVFQNFIHGGKIYEVSGLSFQGIYQNGLDFVSVLFGHTVFAVSFYNRVYLVLSAILLYFALKNICGRKALAANIFLVLFFCAKQTMELAVTPDATLVYVLCMSVFLFSVSVVYYFRTRTQNLIAQVMSVFVMGCLFAVLFICEANSLIFAVPAIAVSFSGKSVQDKRWYYILAVEGMLLVLITCAVVLVSQPEFLLNFAFELPAITAVDLKTTTILLLNILGFLSIYGMWNQKLYYVFPAFMGIYYMFAKPEFVSGIHGQLCGFLCFALYAALGIGLLDDSEYVEVIEIEGGIIKPSLETAKAETKDVKTEVSDKVSDKLSEPVATDKEEQDEIAVVKEMNAKLNQVESGFVPLEFKKPKQREKKTFEYAYEPTNDEMKYDIEVSDDDDFDI